MKCPYCSHEEHKVTDSRNASETNAIRRRRECLSCKRRFTTFETADLILQVKKRDGSYEDFDPQKLIGGLDAACRHTRISREEVRHLAAKVLAELPEHFSQEVSSKEIGEIVMKKLQTLDAVAYIRFACIYCRFKEVGEVMHAIDSTKKEKLANS